METKVILTEKEMPTSWYNIQADLPEPLPPVLHPATGKPVTPDDLAPLFPMGLIMQEMSQERYIEIPEEVQAIYRTWRPTALHRAHRLEKALDTPAKIFYKYEGTSQAGSHKPNTAVAQAYYNMKEGVKRITTETGAGQWGSALAMGCAMFNVELKVYMVRVGQLAGSTLMMRRSGFVPSILSLTKGRYSPAKFEPPPIQPTIISG